MSQNEGDYFKEKNTRTILRILYTVLWRPDNGSKRRRSRTFALPELCWHLKDTSKPTCSENLHVRSPAPLHPTTLGRYTNIVS